MKILHYVYNGPPVSAGYTIRTHSIAKAQRDTGIETNIAISLQSTMANHFTKIKYEPYTTVDGIKYFSPLQQLTIDSWFKLSSKFLSNPNRVTLNLRRQLYSIRKKQILNNYSKYLSDNVGEVDLIHAHTPSIVFDEARTINISFKKKIIYELRGFWNLSLENENQNVQDAVRDEILACQKADKCVAICSGIADVLIKNGIPSKKIEIVPNGVDTNKFQPNEKDVNLLNNLGLQGKIVFGYVTNVRWFEGIQTIIQAWPKIIKEVPNAVFLLIGDGSYFNTIKSMIQEFGIQDSFLALGKISNHTIASYYSLMDIFVVPRINVPVSQIITPLKPLEAMANGKAVLTSNVNALKEMIQDGQTGLLFEADDQLDLAEKCIQLASDYSFRKCLGERARNWVLTNRSWSNLAHKYSEIYKLS